MNPIGTVIASILQYEEFKALMRGEQWVIANGGEINPTIGRPLISVIQNNNYYSVLNPGNKACVPDLRGIFLRGMNVGRNNDEGNSDGDIKVGTYQSDDVGPHVHSAVSGYANSGSADRGDGRHGDGATNTSGPIAGETNRPRRESRPRNVTVNFYIRVG